MQIIQIAVSGTNYGTDVLYALTSNGRMFRKSINVKDSEWEEVGAIPETVEIKF